MATKQKSKAAPIQEITLRQHLDGLIKGMRIDRYSFWTHWREVADYLLPRRYKWLITPNQANRGSPINQRIIDSTGTLALRVLASGMMSGITSPGRPWFKLTHDDPRINNSPEVQAWFDEVTRRMLTVFAESNFYNSLAVLYLDLCAFGTGAMLIYEDQTDVIRCFNSALGEFYLNNGPRQNVTVFAREFVQTTRQIYDLFGEANVSEDVKSAMRTGGAMTTKERIVAHVIEPNPNHIPGARISLRKNDRDLAAFPWREAYWEWSSTGELFLRLKGFHEPPFIAPRWDIVGNDSYGRGPGMDALGDLKQLQVQQKRKAQAIDKMVNPPMIADIALRNEPATLLPGGVTYVPSSPNSPGFKPVYQFEPRLQEMMGDIQSVQERIKAIFFNDLFMMISQLDTVRTATEIDARREEKLVQLGPVLERFQNEALQPAIDRTFGIMYRGGLLPPIPAGLQNGANIKVEYVSILAQAQKASLTGALERFVQFVGEIGAALPGEFTKVDFDAVIERYGQLLDVPPSIIVPTDKAVQAREQQAQQEQQSQQVQDSLAAAQGAATLGKVQVGGGKNAIEAMLGA